MWNCKKCGSTNIRQHMEEGVLYRYSLDRKGTPIRSTQKCEGIGWYDRFLKFSCQDCGLETEDGIEDIAEYKENDVV